MSANVVAWAILGAAGGAVITLGAVVALYVLAATEQDQ